jgi:hypothetical protein
MFLQRSLLRISLGRGLFFDLLMEVGFVFVVSLIAIIHISSTFAGVVQTGEANFSLNGESNLDLQYGMALVGPSQPIDLYQVGDPVKGWSLVRSENIC